MLFMTVVDQPQGLLTEPDDASLHLSCLNQHWSRYSAEHTRYPTGAAGNPTVHMFDWGTLASLVTCTRQPAAKFILEHRSQCAAASLHILYMCAVHVPLYTHSSDDGASDVMT
jgi:hypothetical protein